MFLKQFKFENIFLAYLFKLLKKHCLTFSEPKACGKPEQPPNSTMIAPKGYDVGAVIEYGCDDGHLLVGPAKRSCMDTGFYNEFPPVCKCK